MRFSEIAGLAAIKKTLIAAVDGNHIAHAQLFLGKQGYPHLPLALAYATYINCSNRQDEDSCGKCSSCIKYDKYIHPDLHFVYPTASTKKVAGKDAVSSAFMPDWRTFLLENPYNSLQAWLQHIGAEDKQANISKGESKNIMRTLSMRSFEAPYKVMLIWLPELMHPAAANAILKILEEPSAKTLFFLVSDSAERLLATILSRTQIIHVPPLSDEEMASLLIDRHGVAADKAKHAAHLAEGNVNEAIRLAAEVQDTSAAQFQEWMRLCFKVDFTSMVEWGDKFQQMGKEAQKSLMQYGMSIVREAMVFKHGVEGLQRLAGAEATFAQNFSKVLNERNIPMLTQLFGEAHTHIERNANPKILFVNLSIQIAREFKR